MSKFRKKPVVIEAIEFQPERWREAEAFVGSQGKAVGNWKHENDVLCINILTLEGTMTAQPGDWIIRGVQGEFYPCKPDIFAATYEPV